VNNREKLIIKDIPLLEFDPTPEAVIEPTKVIPEKDVPEHCIVCFFNAVINKQRDEGRIKVIHEMKRGNGILPLYELCELKTGGSRMALFHPGVGAPLAAGLLEEVIALGCRKFIAIGSAGVLKRDISVGSLIIPTSAIRDEGTSYHYLPPGREVKPDTGAVKAIETTLNRRGIPYCLGKTWTTDGIYRETPKKIELRREEDCLTVEMEAAAFFAVASFRKVRFAQLLYGGDDVSGSDWDSREWYKRSDVRETMFEVAIEACMEIE